MNVDLKMEVQTRQNDVALLERQKNLMEKELKQAQVSFPYVIQSNTVSHGVCYR